VTFNVSHLPHQSNDLVAALIVESLVEQARELVKIDCATFGRAGALDQRGRGRIVKPKATHQNSSKLFRPDVRHVAVNRRHSDQQHGGREARLCLRLTMPNGVLPAIAEEGLERSQRKHLLTPIYFAQGELDTKWQSIASCAMLLTEV
jgi:hypothetical protein